VKILLHQYNAVIGHCREQAERKVEACGILYGLAQPRTITNMQRMENVHERPRYRWQFDPQAQVSTWVDLDRQGMRPWVIYHSHLDTPPIMSDEDRLHAANDSSISHLIVSMSDRTSRLWVATHDYVRELPFQVVDLVGDLRVLRSVEFD